MKNRLSHDQSLAYKAVIYEGYVRHHRFKPKKHYLCYRVFSFLVDVDGLDDLSDRLKYFSRNRFNLFSFYDRDHGSGKPDDISRWVRRHLERANLPLDGRIEMLFCPRMFGYAFNPITVYYCYDGRNQLMAILYAVRNTFGERHGYLILVNKEGKLIHQYADKLLHVSPFVDMNMKYHFMLNRPCENLSLTVKVDDGEGHLLNANFSARAHPMEARTLKRLVWRYPFMTLKVVAGIHWEAIKLLAKGLRLRPGTPEPQHSVTIVR